MIASFEALLVTQQAEYIFLHDCRIGQKITYFVFVPVNQLSLITSRLP
jgi:hypothetical protein